MPRLLENSFLALKSVLNKQNVLFCPNQLNLSNIPDLNTKNSIEAQKSRHDI